MFVIIWLGVLFWLSSIPDLRVMPILEKMFQEFPAVQTAISDKFTLPPRLIVGSWAVSMEFLLRKVGHIVCYFILGVLVCHAFPRMDGISTLAVGLFLAIGDEFHQHLTGYRDGRWFDVLFDVFGYAAAIMHSIFSNERQWFGLKPHNPQWEGSGGPWNQKEYCQMQEIPRRLPIKQEQRIHEERLE